MAASTGSRLPSITARRPATIDALVAMMQREFPAAGIRITGRARTTRRQAELMAERIREDRQEFLRTYLRRTHIVEMDRWAQRHPRATLEETTTEFERIIRRAVARGTVVSNHLSDSARDISWPAGSHEALNHIERRINELGGHVIREPRAAGGRHWHVDW
jgi:hypothetical protein